PHGKRDIRVGRRALRARLIAEKFVGGTKGNIERRFRAQLSARATAEKVNFPGEFTFAAVARSFHFVPNTCGDTVPQGSFKSSEFVFTFGTNVDFHAGFVRDGVNRGAAFNHAQLERGTRSIWNAGVYETHRTTNEGIDRIRKSEVRP